MNWTKPNFTQWVTILTILGSIGGYIWHAEGQRVQAQIHDHDMEQRVDSICTAFAVFVSEFKDLRKNREVTLKENQDRDKRLDERLDQVEMQQALNATKFEDFLFYKLKK